MIIALSSHLLLDYHWFHQGLLKIEYLSKKLFEN